MIMWLPHTTFSERLVRENSLDARDFAEWALVPGMTFGSMEKWWGDRGRRERPHEGIDVCLYRDQKSEVHRLREHARLPAMYGGSVVRLCDDFLGRSVMIERDLPAGHRLYVLYGHTIPRSDLEVGHVVREGEIVANLAPLPSSKTKILPHLHISLGWAPGAVSPDRLDWETIPEALTLLDPLQVFTEETITLSALPVDKLRDLCYHAGVNVIITSKGARDDPDASAIDRGAVTNAQSSGC